MIYAGVGSRRTPDDVLADMRTLADRLVDDGWLLRSGGAAGADTAFYKGCKAAGGASEVFGARQATASAVQLAQRFHPAWHRCRPYARALHGRNAMIVFGARLDTPVDAVVCWTPNAEVTGGTGLAIRMAQAYEIPVFNMAVMDWTEVLRELCVLTL